MTRDDPYAWYDPWDLLAYAERKLDEACCVEDNVGLLLRAAHQAHMDDTYSLRRQLERMMEQVSTATAKLPPAPLFIVPK